MAFYESVIIARQDISAAQVDALADELTEVVKTNGGEVAKREYWGLKNLSFRIKKNRKGHYVLLNLDAPAEAVAEYERIMRFNEDVIRYLTIRVKELDTNPSAMMQAKDSRGRDRGPRRDGDRGPRRDDRGPRRDGDGGPRRDGDGQGGGERS